MGERYSSVSDALRPPDELHRSFRAVRESGEGLTGLRRFGEGFEAVSGNPAQKIRQLRDPLFIELHDPVREIMGAVPQFGDAVEECRKV